jgi:hypothetical protein
MAVCHWDEQSACRSTRPGDDRKSGFGFPFLGIGRLLVSDFRKPHSAFEPNYRPTALSGFLARDVEY